MAGLRKLRGKYYVRVWVDGKETLIPTHAAIRRDADIFLRKIQNNETRVKLNLTQSWLEKQMTIADCVNFFRKNYQTEKGI